MPKQTETLFPQFNIAPHLRTARSASGLSQRQLAARVHLQRQQITYFETGARIPSLQQLIQIAGALEVPLERLLTGKNRPSNEVPGLAIELRSLGLVDLWVESPVVPGDFRRPEEVVALAVAGREPDARIVEGIPAVLAWNRWNGILLQAFARAAGRGTVYRLAWLADVALAIHRAGGFPGGCPGRDDLAGFVKRIRQPPADRWDNLGRLAEPPRSPIWRRWRIKYPGDLATFKQRAQHLVSLATSEGRPLSGWDA
jgi:transcriptional regulator with XRE-family HTH domain